MKLSTRSTYGMRALVELALVGGRGPVSASRIATRQHLSIAYLEQLLHRLKKQGVVESLRGPRGGYLLAKDPQRITMAEVVRILDGEDGAPNGPARARARRTLPNGRVGIPRNGNRLKGDSKESQRRAQHIAEAVWRCVHERLTQSLDAVTLQDLCDEVRSSAGEPLAHRYVFHI